VPGGTAERAGIHGLSQNSNGGVILGDIIMSIDGVKMDNLDDLYRFLDKKQIGDTIQAEIFRNGRTMTIPVKLLPNSQGNTNLPGRPARRF
nr:PDZ domain-containing protein [Acidobacteriota bacterium]